MSNQKKKRFTHDAATVRKEDIPKKDLPYAKVTLKIPKHGAKVSKKAPLDQGTMTAQVKCCTKYQAPIGTPKPVQHNQNKIFQDRGTQASGTWHQMLCKDNANEKSHNGIQSKKILLNKNIGKVMTVLKQLFKILLNSFEDKKIYEEPLNTLKETEMVVYAMALECNYDSLVAPNDNYTTFAEDFWDTVLSELNRKKVSHLQRKINALQSENDLAQKNVSILKRQLEHGKQVILRSLEEKAKNEALQAEIKSVLNNVPSQQDVISLKSAKLKLEEELSLKQAELNSASDLMTEIKTEIKSLKNENRALKVNEERLTASLTAYKDGFHSLRQALTDRIQNLRSKACLSSPTCSTFIESPNVSPFPRGSTSTIRDPNSSFNSDLSSTEGDPRPVTISSFNARSSILRDLDDKKHSTSIQESFSKRRPRFSRVKNDCQEFFGTVIPQAIALADNANNLNALGENLVTTMTHVTESSSVVEMCSSKSDI